MKNVFGSPIGLPVSLDFSCTTPYSNSLSLTIFVLPQCSQMIVPWGMINLLNEILE